MITRSLGLFSLALFVSCGGNNAGKYGSAQCSDGIDNDGDGLIDFPDDPGCTSPEDDSEDSLPSPQCNDGRDNDGDGKIDYPDDPGCFAPQQDDETDDCPDGPNCPACSNGKDDDGNGFVDYPNDPGCDTASDTDEYTENPVACGPMTTIHKLPFDGHVTGMLAAGGASNMTGTCGGAGAEDVYELRIQHPKVMVATTDNSMADTVLYIREASCTDASHEMVCNDDISTANPASTITVSLAPGTYFLVVDAKDGAGGAYDLQVHYFVGEGVECTGQDDCGPGLVCRIPLGDSVKKCSKHVCSDGVDDDGDGKADYPNDPGCSSPDDDDETDDCPSGPMCPECANGRDDDRDGKIDYPADPQCHAASDTSESCPSHEGIQALTMPATMGDTSTGAVSDFQLTCASSPNVPDLTYRLDLPALSVLNMNLDAGFDSSTALYKATCTGAPIACSDPLEMTVNNVAAGTYYFTVDGYFDGEVGPFTINVSGTIVANASCESPLAQSGALTCATGYVCKGAVGSRTCQKAACSDGIDNDGDGKQDYPNDPGCDSPTDDDESDPCPGAGCPVCADGLDNDGDGQKDYPNDFGCAAASGTTEVFCMPEHDPATKITQHTTTGTTAGKSNDFASATCQSNTAGPDVSYGLSLPVKVATLQIDTIGTTFDTILSLSDANCTRSIACDDDGGGSLTSKLVLTNVGKGNYAITIDGYGSASGAFTLNVKGTVTMGTACTSPLFTSGVLVCPAGTTCNGGTCH